MYCIEYANSQQHFLVIKYNPKQCLVSDKQQINVILDDKLLKYERLTIKCFLTIDKFNAMCMQCYDL